eukprot:symbB.v1.2.028084.t1/scaffold2830.1/size69359/6
MAKEGGDERPLAVTIVTLDYYVAKPGPGDSNVSRCTGKLVKQVPVIRVFGHTATGQTACVHVHGVPTELVEANESEETFLHGLAEGLEKAMAMHQSALSPYGVRDPYAAYLYDIRWVRGWNSIYGHSERKNFVQLWATLPQHTSTMAHLLQQGAVLSTSFQPFEVHLPYLLHFLDSFGLGGMRDLVVAPEHLALRNANNGTFRAPAETLETFPYHLKWQIPGRAFKQRLLQRAGSEMPWWCRGSNQRPQSIHPKASRCEVEVDCRASDVLHPIAATASQTPSPFGLQQMSVQQRTSGWICETLRELWRDEERRCLALGLPYPWTSDPPEPGAPGDGQGLTPDVVEDCMIKQLHAAYAGKVAPKEELSSPQLKEVAWSQREVNEKVSPKFAEACEKWPYPNDCHHPMTLPQLRC